MNILYLSDILNIHDFRFLEKLTRTSHHITLYTFFHARPDLPSDIASLPSLNIIHHRFSTYPDGIHGSSWKWLRFLTYYSEMRKGISMLKRDLERLKIDLLYAGFAATSGYIAARTGFHPLLVMPWGSDILLYPKWRRRYRRQVREALLQADRIGPVDAEMVRQAILELADVPAERIFLAPWGVDLARFNPACGDDGIRKKLGWETSQVTICTRKMEPLYQVDRAIRAVSRLKDRFPGLRLILVGSGSCEPEHRRVAESLGVGDRIHFAGFVPNEKLPHYLNAADLYVSCSLSDGSSLSLMEAMACGVPPVVSDIPANREWVEHGVSGLLFHPERQEDFEKRLTEVLEQTSRRVAMGSAALEVARRQANWDINFQKVLAELEALHGGFSSRYRR